MCIEKNGKFGESNQFNAKTALPTEVMMIVELQPKTTETKWQTRLTPMN
jgi:hypothetical protein